MTKPNKEKCKCGKDKNTCTYSKQIQEAVEIANTIPPDPQPESWRDRFDERFVVHFSNRGESIPCVHTHSDCRVKPKEIKDFISQEINRAVEEERVDDYTKYRHKRIEKIVDKAITQTKAEIREYLQETKDRLEVKIKKLDNGRYQTQEQGEHLFALAYVDQILNHLTKK